jgi:hypothetical protein
MSKVLDSIPSIAKKKKKKNTDGGKEALERVQTSTL